MSSAKISPKARIGTNVHIGDYTIIHDNVVVEDGTRIESFCELGIATSNSDGSPLHIGKNALIRSHSVFYEGSSFGAGLTTGHRVTVREKTSAGLGLQIGTLSDFQGHLTIGNYTRTHSNVHLGQGTQLGNFVWIFPYSIFTNDPHPPSEIRQPVIVEDFAVVATQCCILPGVRIGTRALVAAGSIVNKDVEPGMVVGGNPARVICHTSRVKRRDDQGDPAYPWTRHFHRGYPEEVVQEWRTPKE